MSKKFFLFRRSDPVGSDRRFSEGGSDIPILGIPADLIAFMTAGRGTITLTFNNAGIYEENELFIGDSIEKTNVTISCEEGQEMRLIEAIMQFASTKTGKPIFKFDVLGGIAAFNNVIIDNVPFDGLSAIRLVPKVRRKQRFCLNCGKILPLDIPKNFYHECKRPDFVKDKLGI